MGNAILLQTLYCFAIFQMYNYLNIKKKPQCTLRSVLQLGVWSLHWVDFGVTENDIIALWLFD
jgi:hypothetical protein